MRLAISYSVTDKGHIPRNLRLDFTGAWREAFRNISAFIFLMFPDGRDFFYYPKLLLKLS